MKSRQTNSILLALWMTLAGCAEKQPPSSFITLGGGFGSAHILKAKAKLRRYSNGPISDGQKDFDSDGYNDWYILAPDGNGYCTSSRRLSNGKDNPNNRNWQMVSRAEVEAAPLGSQYDVELYK
jgi:hypothetical protein